VFRRLVNGDFMREADHVKRIGELYDRIEDAPRSPR
jgi:hypothetical protein